VRARLERADVFALAVNIGVPLALVLIFVVLRDSPPDWGCGESEPPGQDARLADFRRGAIPLHAAGAALLLAAIAWLSARRVRRADGRGAIGRPTAVGLAVAAVYAVTSLIYHDVFFPLLIIGFLTVGLTIYAASEGNPLVFLIGLPALAAIAFGLTRERARGYVLAALAWIELLLVLPGSLGAIYINGHGPIIC
jgi:hypothetical protein